MSSSNPTRVLICGSRDYDNTDTIRRTIYRLMGQYRDLVIVEGGAKGADRIAHDVATKAGLTVETFEADWKTHGMAAGPLRNISMLESGIDECHAFVNKPLTESVGTEHCVRMAAKMGIYTVVVCDGK